MHLLVGPSNNQTQRTYPSTDKIVKCTTEIFYYWTKLWCSECSVKSHNNHNYTAFTVRPPWFWISSAIPNKHSKRFHPSLQQHCAKYYLSLSAVIPPPRRFESTLANFDQWLGKNANKTNVGFCCCLWTPGSRDCIGLFDDIEDPENFRPQ